MPRLSRRAGPLLGLVLFVLAASGAGATYEWCKSDPILRIDGQTADVVLSSHLAMRSAATGPARLVVTVPTGVAAELVATDRGFGGHGYDVRFAESPALRNAAGTLQVRVEAYAPASDDALPLRVEFAPRGAGRLSPGSAEGTANAWVVLETG